MSSTTDETQRIELIKTTVLNLKDNFTKDFRDYHNLPQTQDDTIVLIGEDRATIQNGLEQAYKINIEGGLNVADTLSFEVYTDGEKRLRQLIWLDYKNSDIANLVNLTPRNFEQHLLGITFIAEEVSHAVYTKNFYEHNQKLPPYWIKEMIASLDKYQLLQHMYFENKGRVMTAQEDSNVRRLIFTAIQQTQNGQYVQNQFAPKEHQKGHLLGIKLVDTLNRLVSTGKHAEANRIMNIVYKGTEEQVTKLLSGLRI